jgi:hypothetical protein
MVQGLQCRVRGSGFRVQGLALRLSISGRRVQGQRSGVLGLGSGVQGSRSRVRGLGSKGFKFSWFRVEGFEVRALTLVPGSITAARVTGEWRRGQTPLRPPLAVSPWCTRHPATAPGEVMIARSLLRVAACSTVSVSVLYRVCRCF